jgi:hypothetical protein
MQLSINCFLRESLPMLHTFANKKAQIFTLLTNFLIQSLFNYFLKLQKKKTKKMNVEKEKENKREMIKKKIT